MGQGLRNVARYRSGALQTGAVCRSLLETCRDRPRVRAGGGGWRQAAFIAGPAGSKVAAAAAYVLGTLYVRGTRRRTAH